MSSPEKFEIEVGGEIGKNNTLPVDYLVELAKKLQALILEIASYDLPTDQSIVLENFKLELKTFKKGSAIPGFIFTPRVQEVVVSDVKTQRAKVASVFDSLMNISSTGNYQSLKEAYPEPLKRTKITTALYNFIESTGTSPVNIFQNGKPKYKLKAFKKEVKDSIITDIITEKAKKPDKLIQLARVEIQGNKHKLLDLFDKKYNAVEFAPEIIIHQDTLYQLRFPLRSAMDIIDGNVIIENEMLGIYACGETPDLAEAMFNEEFDYIYRKYYDLPNKKLTKDVIAIKNFLNHIVI